MQVAILGEMVAARQEPRLARQSQPLLAVGIVAAQGGDAGQVVGTEPRLDPVGLFAFFGGFVQQPLALGAGSALGLLQ